MGNKEVKFYLEKARDDLNNAIPKNYDVELTKKLYRIRNAIRNLIKNIK